MALSVEAKVPPRMQEMELLLCAPFYYAPWRCQSLALGIKRKRGLTFADPLLCGRLRIRTADPLLVRQML